MKLSHLSALLLATSLFVGCKDDETKPKPPVSGETSFSILFDAKVGAAPFALNTPYTKADGQRFTATKFKYLVSNFTLTRADGSTHFVPESYFLVDASRPATATVNIAGVPAGEYTGMSYIIGVDAPRNTAGAQTGALDPGNDMFWNWNQGYIYVKLDGNSPQSPTNALTYHVGGVSNIRTVSPSFNNAKLVIAAGRTPQIRMNVNPVSLFEGATAANRIDFSTSPTAHGGTTAARVADNYAAGMFSVTQIQAN